MTSSRQQMVKCTFIIKPYCHIAYTRSTVDPASAQFQNARSFVPRMYGNAQYPKGSDLRPYRPERTILFPNR
jgi:hypothetical protein